MVQYVLKRHLTDSTVTVDGSKTINELWNALDRMIVALSTLKIMGKDDLLIEDGVSAENAVAECKKVFQTRILEDVNSKLNEMGSDWSFDDLIMPLSTDQ